MRVLHPGEEEDEVRSIAVMLCDHQAMDRTMCRATSKVDEGEVNTSEEAEAVTIDVESQGNASFQEARQGHQEPQRHESFEVLACNPTTSHEQAVEESLSPTGSPNQALTQR